MATKNDLIKDTLITMGVASLHNPPNGNDHSFAKRVLDRYLLAINSEQALDFDPTADEIPDERMWPLTVILSQLIGGPYGKPTSEDVIQEFRRQLYAGVIGSSDFIEEESVNY